MRPGAMAVNLAKNAAAPWVRRLAPDRGTYGMDGDLSRVASVLDELAPALAALDVTVRGADLVELGSGRTPQMAMALALAGAREVVGLDPFLQIDESFKTIDPATIAPAPAGAPAFREATGTSDEAIAEGVAAVSSRGWPVRFAQTDGVTLPLATDSVDLVTSKSTLEHVRAGDVDPLLAELRRVLRLGGGMAHMIDLRDHMHIDGDLVHGDWLEALRYPDWLFELMFSRRSTSINRLRHVEWRAAFERAGFEIAGVWPRVYPLADGFRAEKLDARWRTMGTQELAIGQVLVALRKPGS